GIIAIPKSRLTVLKGLFRKMNLSTATDNKKLPITRGVNKRTENPRNGIPKRTIETEAPLDSSRATATDGRVKSSPKRRCIFETEFNKKYQQLATSI
ncbi:MAG: hypothetical protein ACE1ZC_01990, partial [Nitrososphaerales archaeon]